LRGQLLTPDSAGYDLARRVFNAAVDRRPAAVVRCAADADVALAIRFAQDHRLPLSVRAGGHALGGQGVVAGGVVVDLGLRNEVAVAADGTTALVGGGCRWGEVIDRLDGTGLAAVGGFDRRVGVGGLTLGGGYGMLSRLHGLACDNLEAATVVMADGSTVLAAEAERHDLLWALRGAGANFGVATSLRLRLHRPAPLWRGVAVQPLRDVAALLRGYRELAAALADATTLYLGFALSPAGGGQAQLILHHLGRRIEARQVLAAAAALGPGGGPGLVNLSVRQAHELNPDGYLAEGHGHAWRAHFLPALGDAAALAIATQVDRARGDELWIVIEHLGGAVARVPAGATAFPHRDAAFGIVSTVRWRPPAAPPARALRIQEDLHAALEPHALGCYVNYLGHPASAREAAAAYGHNLPRLRALKQRLDPDNLFRHNVNIRPSGDEAP
jgi:FAD/FMN-containing dehydrogenase